MMDYVEKIQEKVDVAHGHRLGTAFATRNILIIRHLKIGIID